jgi:hypothetical protein
MIQLRRIGTDEELILSGSNEPAYLGYAYLVHTQYKKKYWDEILYTHFGLMNFMNQMIRYHFENV